MVYSIMGLCALFVCLIINKEILFKKHNLPKTYKIYRIYLIVTMSFFVCDAFWGFYDEYHYSTALFVNTNVFFILMTISVMFWTIFVAAYANKGKKMNIAVMISGAIIFLYLIVMTIINFFKPVLFDVDGIEYIPYWGRHLLFILQIILFAIVSSVSLFFFYYDKKNLNRYRFLAIGLFGIFMALSIIVQFMFPHLPIYTFGSIISICLIHIYVVGSEKEAVVRKLKASLKREKVMDLELGHAKELLYVDPLTGAKSKHAFVEIESKMDSLIDKKDIEEFSIVVFDINGLKVINDTKGHEYGDYYIKESYNMIKEVYKNTEVYRFGGDEFVAILDGDDFNNRDELINKFNEIIDNNIDNEKPVVSVGMADFNSLEDHAFNAVFAKADEKMYIRKKYLKSIVIN